MLITSAVVASALIVIGAVTRRALSGKNGRLNAALYAATGEAFARRHALVTIEHLMLSISFDEEVRDALVAKGIDVEALREGLEEELSRIEPTVELVVRPKADARVLRVIRLARGTWVGATLPAIVESIETGPTSRARELLARRIAKASTPRLLDAPASAAGPYRAPVRATTAIRVFNDEKTPLEFVMEVLREHLGIDIAHARYLMYRIHLERSCVVATREQADAEEIATKMTTAARAKGLPLRVTTERPES